MKFRHKKFYHFIYKKHCSYMYLVDAPMHLCKKNVVEFDLIKDSFCSWLSFLLIENNIFYVLIVGFTLNELRTMSFCSSTRRSPRSLKSFPLLLLLLLLQLLYCVILARCNYFMRCRENQDQLAWPQSDNVNEMRPMIDLNAVY